LTSTSLILASSIIAFAVIIAAVAFGSAIGDGIAASKAIESIARQPEARGNIFSTFFLGVGILEAFPVIGLALALYLFYAVVNVPALIGSVVGAK
jgi:F-type H+-transporting ATPase subunit c